MPKASENAFTTAKRKAGQGRSNVPSQSEPTGTALKRRISRKPLQISGTSNLDSANSQQRPLRPYLTFPLRNLLRRIREMGILENISGPLAQQISQRGTGVVVASAFASFLVLAVVLNVLNQLLFRNSNEPPVVFHWFPIIGSTVFYGMDPYSFFFENKAKVRCPYLEMEHSSMLTGV